MQKIDINEIYDAMDENLVFSKNTLSKTHSKYKIHATLILKALDKDNKQVLKLYEKRIIINLRDSSGYAFTNAIEKINKMETWGVPEKTNEYHKIQIKAVNVHSIVAAGDREWRER